MKKVAVVGSTGSIGRQVINVVRRYPAKFQIVALIAGGSVESFARQIDEFKPPFAALADETAAKNYKEAARAARLKRSKSAGRK